LLLLNPPKTTVKCSAEVFFPSGDRQRSPEVRASCEDLLKANLTAQEEALFHKYNMNQSLLSAQNLPGMYKQKKPCTLFLQVDFNICRLKLLHFGRFRHFGIHVFWRVPLNSNATQRADLVNPDGVISCPAWAHSVLTWQVNVRHNPAALAPTNSLPVVLTNRQLRPHRARQQASLAPRHRGLQRRHAERIHGEHSVQHGSGSQHHTAGRFVVSVAGSA